MYYLLKFCVLKNFTFITLEELSQTCYDLEVGFALYDVGDVTSCTHTKIMHTQPKMNKNIE